MDVSLSSIPAGKASLLRASRLLFFLLLGVSGAAVGQVADVVISIDDPAADHVHAPGAPFEISVTVSDPGIRDARVFAQWFDPAGQSLSTRVELAPDLAVTLLAPSGEIGHYDLRISSDHPDVRFPPQDPGFHMDYGFSILPERRVADRTVDNDSFFAMTHANEKDPYLRGWIKTLVWNTKTPASFAARIQTYQQEYGLQELPMINGGEWESDDTVPISDQQVDALGNRFGTYLDALVDTGVHVPAWQLGREENGGDWLGIEFSLDNLRRKAQRIRQELDQRGLQDVLTVFSMRGFDYDEYTGFAASAAAQHIDVLGFHTYKWNDFPTPESHGEWLRVHTERLRQIMLDHGGPTRLWATEYGIPHQGNNNPDTFFGYPASGIQVQGASREHGARYLVKSHVITMATGLVEKIFWYNYYDRDNDLDYAEDYFGLRMYAGDDAPREERKYGHTKPAYTAYATMVDQLDDLRFVRHTRPGNDIWAYEFADPASPDDGAKFVAWVYPEGARSIAPSELRADLSADRIVGITGLYGEAVESVGGQIVLGARPLYIEFGPAPAAVDHLPVANDDSGTTVEGAAVSLDVLANDSGLEDVPITLRVATQASHGTATIGAGNLVSYVPTPGFVGTDTFTYEIVDADGDIALASVVVDVNMRADAYELVSTSAADESAPAVSLEGAELSGTVGIFVTPETQIRQVSFYLDDPNLSQPAYRIDETAPFSLSGTESLFDTTVLEDGAHTLTAVVTYSGGSTTLEASFLVSNHVALPTLTLSASPASVLEGDSVTLSWTSTNAHTCTAGGEWAGELGPAGDLVVGPLLVTSVFTLTCVGDGGTKSAEVTVTVAGPVSPPDIDSDGLPDDWEVSFFGNLDMSGDGDPDADGLSNLAEFELSTDPTNSDSDGDGADDGSEVLYGSDPAEAMDNWHDHRPDRPVIAASTGALGVRNNVFDIALDYSDPDQTPLRYSQWQISRDEQFATLVLDRNVNRKTLLRTPAAVLELDSHYFLRTRHWDSTGLPSLWSEAAEIRTLSSDPLDLDKDGTEDAYQVEGFVDTDQNGLDDRAEADMCALHGAETGQVIGFRSDAGTLRCVTSISSSGIPTELRQDEVLPYGLFGFQVHGLPVDPAKPAEIIVTLYFPEPLPAETQWYVYDEAGFVLQPYDGLAVVEGNTVTLHFVDGGSGDKDGFVNGIIVDPSGPAFDPLAAVDDPVSTSATPDAGSPDGGASGGGAMGLASLLSLLLLLLGRLRAPLAIHARPREARHGWRQPAASL